MTRNVAHLPKGASGIVVCLMAILLAIMLGIALYAGPRAYADDEPASSGAAATEGESENVKTALELQQQIESAQAAYGDARDEAERVNAEVEANRERIAELESQIPAQQERSARAARELYKFQNEGVSVVELLLSADSLHDFLVGFEYVTKVSDANLHEMERLNTLRAEVGEAQTALEQSYAEANAKVDDARVALEELEEAQAEVQRRIEEEARIAAEIAAQAAAMAENPRNNDDESTSVVNEAAAQAGEQAAEQKSEGAAEGGAEGEGSEEGAADDGGGGDSEAVSTAAVNAPDPNMSADEASFLAEWTPRIDAYLAGSPLAGQGATFAKAAYTYNVDPRWSPAISFTESSKGAVCFLPHNAWGWGSSSWSSWEEAIDAHVGGLSRGYGYTISVEAAQKYCPPNWQMWYDRTLEQMNMI